MAVYSLLKNLKHGSLLTLIIDYILSPQLPIHLPLSYRTKERRPSSLYHSAQVYNGNKNQASCVQINDKDVMNKNNDFLLMKWPLRWTKHLRIPTATIRKEQGKPKRYSWRFSRPLNAQEEFLPLLLFKILSLGTPSNWNEKNKKSNPSEPLSLVSLLHFLLFSVNSIDK